MKPRYPTQIEIAEPNGRRWRIRSRTTAERLRDGVLLLISLILWIALLWLLLRFVFG